MPLRQEFPPEGTEYLGGWSDGWEYRTVFAGGNLEKSYGMVRRFLAEEGYADLPLPTSAEELKLFRNRRSGQIQLFEEAGYVHNPVKVLFPLPGKEKRGSLILCVYNETAPNHLLRFHGVWKSG
jgi:hypothetical protein